ncbi:uncharacterized protein DS421_8g224370 [Arachis hypogaea]|nr:uncharacterized protein DS421_8g224370 [Arachis hypogaea]
MLLLGLLIEATSVIVAGFIGICRDSARRRSSKGEKEFVEREKHDQTQTKGEKELAGGEGDLVVMPLVTGKQHCCRWKPPPEPLSLAQLCPCFWFTFCPPKPHVAMVVATGLELVDAIVATARTTVSTSMDVASLTCRPHVASFILYGYTREKRAILRRFLPWQALCRVSPLSVATSHPLSENVPMLCHSTANHLSVLNQVGIESIDSFASVTNAQPSGV